MSESINIENKKQNHQKPPLSLARIACEILAGLATGLAVAYPVVYVILYVIIYVILGKTTDGFMGDKVLGNVMVMAIIIFAFPIVYGPGSAVGVYLLGRRGTQTGSLLATLGLGCLGGLFMFVILLLIIGVKKIVLLALVLLIPPIIATIGFNATRRYKEQPSS